MIDLECATETRNCFEARELGCRVVAVFLLFLFPFLSKTKKISTEAGLGFYCLARNAFVRLEARDCAYFADANGKGCQSA